MKPLRKAARHIALPLAGAMALSTLPVNVVHAGLVTSDSLVAERQAHADRERVAQFMAREDVRSQFRSYGVDAAEAERRVAALSDAEVSRLAVQIDQDPAGQSFLGAVAFIAIIVLVVLLVTDAVGETDVY